MMNSFTQYTNLGCLMLILIWSWLLAGCRNNTDTTIDNNLSPVAYSLSGDPLFALEESDVTSGKKDSLLQVAYEDWKRDSTDLNHIIWYGRRTAYLYDYPKAIQIYSQGLRHHPQSPELYRHRGHRYISIRDFDLAIDDFKKAIRYLGDREVEIEPDGLPNRLNIPLSSLQFNIYYHLALAYYLNGDFSNALEAYKKCMVFSTNPDLLVATSDWYYMTLRRLGLHAEARDLIEGIDAEMNIIENSSYHKRLLFYKEEVAENELLDFSNDSKEDQLDIVTQGYGVANWHLYSGDTLMARDLFVKILACDYWPAFGYIAAEADEYRLSKLDEK